MTKHCRDWRRCFVCLRYHAVRVWRFHLDGWYCDNCYQRCVRRKATLVIRAQFRTLFSSPFYKMADSLPLLSVNTQRKNEIVDFMSDRENQISILRNLYEQGWRLLLLPNHSNWQEPRGCSIKLGRTKAVMTYYLGIDDEEITVDIVAMIKPDLLNSDAAALVESMNQNTMTYDSQRLEDGTLLKVILTNSPNGTYKDVWRLSGIRIVQIPTAEQQFERFEKNASLLTYAMRGVP